MTNDQLKVSLQSHNFHYDSELKIWIENNKEFFNYNDGDIHENYILEVLSQVDDCSVLSQELVNHIKDWPSQYHLTSKRSNLLRPFSDIFKGKRILEIGCGCGAITRFLAESGANIIAVEGSKRRSLITRTRCKDLDNVTVICSSSQNLPDIGDFDFVMLIGVLEYAQCFLGADGQRELLTSCKKRLTTSGSLFVAIENQLGMKYLAGAKEDHLGIPMVGINNAYHENGVRTFGRSELKDIIKSVGFSNIQEYLPFPDYKLPSLVVSPKGHGAYSEVIYPLVSEMHHKDAQSSGYYTFSLEEATRTIWKNNLSSDLANSFLMVVSSEENIVNVDKSLAWYYSDARINGTQKKIRITEENGNFNVETSKISGELLATEKFHQGESLWLSLVDLVNKHSWQLEDMTSWVQKWINDILLDKFISSEYEWDTILPSKYLDATPFNIIMTNNGHEIFDLELENNKPLKLSYLVFRGLFNSLLRITSIAPTENVSDYNIYNVTKAVMISLFPKLDDDLLDVFLQDEIDVVSQVINVNRNDLFERYRNSFFVVRNSLSDLDLELVRSYRLNEENARDLSDKKDELVILKNRISDLENKIELQNSSEKIIKDELRINKERLDKIFSSKSWRVISLVNRLFKSNI